MMQNGKTQRKPLIGLMAFAIVLFTMPLGHALMVITQLLLGPYQYFGAVLIGLLGSAALFFSVGLKCETTGTIWGFLAGIFIWTGFTEFSYVFFAAHLGISPILQNSEIVTKPEYRLLPSSIGLLIPMMIYFLLNGRTRCNFFLWWRRQLKLPISAAQEKAERNYALITAMETIVILWTFYIVLMITYDPRWFGDRHALTYSVFGASLLWSLYLITQLLKLTQMAYAIRYAIPTVIIFWNCIEILGRWNLFREIWIEPARYALEMSIIGFVFMIFIVLSRLAFERKSRP